MKASADNQKTPTAYSYVRFSTPEQLKGDSLRRQVEASQEYAKQHGLWLDESLRLHDLGVSAFRGANQEVGRLAAFIKAVETGRVKKGSFLLVESLDRLSRQQVTKALTLFLNLLSHGITIVTLIDGQVYTEESVGDQPHQIIISLCIMIRARDESLTKSKRLIRVHEQKRVNIKKKSSHPCVHHGC